VCRISLAVALLTLVAAPVPGQQPQAEPVPRFEVGPCPFEPGAWAGSVTLECGRLIVPANRSQPTGGSLRLAVAILRAPEPSLPPLVMLEGGPGSSGMRTFLPAAAASPLPSLRDVVVYDQRGAGHSEPALCPDYNRRRREAFLADTDRRDAVARETPVVAACLATLRAEQIDPSAFTTAESAADLADLRRALGYQSWDVYGHSYGARQALAALAVDPEGIRSLVLDRPVTPGPQRAELLLRVQRSLDRLFAACAADAGCRKAFPDPAADLATLVEQLDARPLRLPRLQAAGVSSELGLSGAMLIHAFAGGLNSPARMGRIPLLLHELRRGDSERAAPEIARWSIIRHAPAPATLSIMPCNDEYGRHALALEDSVRAIVSPPVRSLTSIRSVRTCALWTDQVEPASLPMPTGSPTPVLILVGEFDTSGAPPEDGRHLAALLGNATLVELPAQGHAVAVPPNPCIQGMILQFWLDPNRPVDTSCVAGMPGIRFVTRF
jgi:pimeloyl-ACP methyl ester carboxylesterase